MSRAIAEIIAAAMTGLLHPLFVDVFRAKALFIALAGLVGAFISCIASAVIAALGFWLIAES